VAVASVASGSRCYHGEDPSWQTGSATGSAEKNMKKSRMRNLQL
jgi:hypothetical protein